MNIKKDILWRVYLAFFFICIFGVRVLIQIGNLQFVEGAHWKAMADSLSTDFIPIEATRGNIYSNDSSLLATSIPEYDLRMDMKAEGLTRAVFKAGVDSLAMMFSREFKDKPESEYRQMFKNAYAKRERYCLLRRKVSFEQLTRMKEWPLFRLGRYKGGLVIVERTRRKKPFQMLAERTIGYSIEGVAPVGLEGAYDNVLAGVGGKRLMQKVAGGIWVPINDDNEIEPENGKDIMTTIDINIQDVAEDALLKALVQNNAEHGCAILMEVKTGEIRAIANLKRKSVGVYEEGYNYAVGESAEPGSTFKLVSALALLEDGYVDDNDSISTGNGEKTYFDRVMRDSEQGGHGRLTLKKSFELSSNVGISSYIYQHYAKNPAKFVEHMKRLKLDQPLGLQITGEGTPNIKGPDSRYWSRVSLPWMSIGYEVAVTPMQILTLYNAVANGGKMIKPLLVKEIRETGKQVHKFETETIIESICSPATLEKLKAMMEGVVDHGTATNLKNLDYKVAGKTGTAQIADNSRGYKGLKVHKASFVGYFPADNPQYTCIVVINAPSNGIYYGSLVAGPVFREIADKVYSGSLDMHKDIEDELDDRSKGIPYAKSGYKNDLQEVLNRLKISSSLQSDSENTEWVGTSKKHNSIVLTNREISGGLVPDVTGMGLKDALFLLENKGLKVSVSGAGKVKSQSVPAGTKAVKGNYITLQLG
jgi:cell division protein FtsI (penicillin-binding protein 3)